MFIRDVPWLNINYRALNLPTLLFQPTHLSADWLHLDPSWHVPLIPCTLNNDTNRRFHWRSAVASKSLREIKETVKKVYSDKTLMRIQIYKIMKKVKKRKPAAEQRVFNTKRQSETQCLLSKSPPRWRVTGMSL
jgi:hypothetical protein